MARPGALGSRAGTTPQAWWGLARSRLPCAELGRREVAGPARADTTDREVTSVGSVVKKRRKRMSKKKHRKLLRRTRMQRRQGR